MDDNQTTAQVKEYLEENRDAGVSCPCCGQFVKVYRRSITSGMAHFLICAYKYCRTIGVSQFRVKDVIKWAGLPVTHGGGDDSKLRYWGLIRQIDIERDVEGKKMFYVITADGVSFVNRKKMVQKYCQVYNNEVLRYSGEFVTIEQSLKNKFDYYELMGYFEDSETKQYGMI